MSVFSDAERDDLAKAVVVANTPASLGGWLQRHPGVRRIAESATEDQLLDELFPILRERDKNERALGTAYAVLVAIAMKRRAQGGQIGTAPFQLGLLKWGRAMWDAFSRTTVPTTTEVLTLSGPTPGMQSHTDHGAGPVRLFNAAGNIIVTNQD